MQLTAYCLKYVFVVKISRSVSPLNACSHCRNSLALYFFCCRATCFEVLLYSSLYRARFCNYFMLTSLRSVIRSRFNVLVALAITYFFRRAACYASLLAFFIFFRMSVSLSLIILKEC